MAEAKIYECGQLRYTLGRLIMTVFLIMLAFFCMSFIAAAVSNSVNLRLKALGAPNTLLVLIMSTIGQIFNMTVCPAVSFKSDRYRGKRWGRRNYFIITSMPPIAVAAVVFAFSGDIGNFLANVICNWYPVSPAAVTIGIIAVTMLLYQFFRMYIGSVIYYLYKDIIPSQFLSRVVGAVQVATVACSSIFSFFFLRYAEKDFKYLLLGSAIFYAVGIGVMCFYVKEPKLPPLTEEEKKKSRGGAGVLTFMKESFSHKFYWLLFLNSAAWAISMCYGTFAIFFSKEMGLTLKDIGNLGGTSGLINTCVSLAVASIGTILIDRWHPVRVNVMGRILSLVIAMLGCKWIFFTISPANYFWIALFQATASLLVARFVVIAGMPMLMQLYPTSRFGQFCSAGSMLRSILVMFFSFLLGVLLDIGAKVVGDSFVYRYIHLWHFIWVVAGVIIMTLLYREWKKLGGEKDYAAPAPWSPEKYEQIDTVKTGGVKAVPFKISLLLWDLNVLLFLAAGCGLVWYLSRQGAVPFKVAVWALPGPGIALLVWLLLRLRMMLNLKYHPDYGVPHHGMMILGACQQLMIFGVAVFEALLLSRENIDTASKMWCFTSASIVVAMIVIAIFIKIERPVGTRK